MINTTALLTPLSKNQIDYNSLDNLLEWQHKGGIKQLLLLGTTAESTLLTNEERWQLLRYIKDNSYNKFKLMVSVGTCSTAEMLKNAQKALNLGADSLLVLTPYYSKYTEYGLMKHFEKLRKLTDKKIILYNVPHRTGISVNLKQVKTLADSKFIDGIKECSDSPELIKDIYKDLPYIDIYCGNENHCCELEKHGISNCISVISNFAPRLAQMPSSIPNQLYDLLSLQPSPVAAKYLTCKLALIATCEMRLPLSPPTTQQQKDIDEFIEQFREKLV